MRILLATGIYPPDIGGPATYSHLLKIELPKRGAKVEILSFGEVRHLPKILRHFVYFLKAVKRGRAADVIFAQDPVSVGLPAALAAKILRKRFVLKVVGDYAWEQGMQRWGVQELLDEFLVRKYGFLVEFFRKIEKFVADNADKIIVPSQYLKKVITIWGVPENKIFVVHNAFAISMSLRFWADRTGLSERQSLGLRGKVLISAGRLVPWKGFAMLIEIMPDLLKKFSDLQLVIIGDGPERESLEYKVNSLGLMKSVHFTGNLPHSKVMEYLVASDIFVLNTAYEGFSHQILEAMIIGKPIITTMAGGNPELINEASVFIVDFNDEKGFKDKIAYIFNSGLNIIVDNQRVLMAGEDVKKYIENARRNAQKISEKFSLDSMINKTLKILEGV